MITPNDIATKDFKKVAVGYSPEEVDTFLDDIYVDYERLYRESQNPKEQPKPAEPVETAAGAAQYKNLEKTLERTIVLAETAAEEMKTAAKAEAEQIVKEARLQAQELLTAARMKSYELEQDIDALQTRYELMKTRVKLLRCAEIELLDKNEILAEKEEAALEEK